jgi:hypothetical protein
MSLSTPRRVGGLNVFGQATYTKNHRTSIGYLFGHPFLPNHCNDMVLPCNGILLSSLFGNTI